MLINKIRLRHWYCLRWYCNGFNCVNESLNSLWWLGVCTLFQFKKSELNVNLCDWRIDRFDMKRGPTENGYDILLIDILTESPETMKLKFPFYYYKHNIVDVKMLFIIQTWIWLFSNGGKKQNYSLVSLKEMRKNISKVYSS